jgi:hypothetical protein
MVDGHAEFRCDWIPDFNLRERVIRIFPNDESALRLIGALLAEQNEAWQERKYLDMDEFKEWATAHTAAGEDNNVVALAS